MRFMYLDEYVETLEQLKKQYHKLVMKMHPDKGGSTLEMQTLNAEYEELFKRVKNKHVNKNGETYEKDTDETPEEFRDLIEQLLHLDGIIIEIIGCFIWIRGNTKPHKNRLKELTFRWHSKKQMWYRSPEGYRRFGKGEYSIEDIREMYHSQVVNINKRKGNQTALVQSY